MATPIAHLKSDKALELLLYGEIGFGPLSAASVAKLLDANKDADLIRVRISSGGGDAFEGITIHNLLAKHPARVEVDVDGQASSAASLIAMAGDHVRVSSNSLMMIHQAWDGGGVYTAADHMSAAEALTKINDSAAQMYAQKTGKAVDEISKLMESDKWLSAKEAVALGLANEVTDPKAIAASVARVFAGEKPEETDMSVQQESDKDEEHPMPMAAEGEVDGNAVIEQLAKATGKDKAAVVALMTDKMDAIAKMLNDAIDRDGSESEEERTTPVEESSSAPAASTAASKGSPTMESRIRDRQIVQMSSRIQALEADKSARAEKEIDDEVQRRIDEGLVLDGEREEFKKFLKSDPTAARKLFSVKRVPAPQASLRSAKPKDERTFEDLTDPQKRLVKSFQLAGIAGGDMKACIAKVLEQERN